MVTRLRTRIQILGPLRVAATLGLLAASAVGLVYAGTEPTTSSASSTGPGTGLIRGSDEALTDVTPLQEALRPDEAAVATSPSLLPPQISVGDRVLILAGYLDQDPLAGPTVPQNDGLDPTPGRVIGVDPAAVTLAVDVTDLAEVAGPLVGGAATVVVVSAGR